jgi:hypothetical protein
LSERTLRDRPAAVLGVTAVTMASLGLFFVSRGKWSNAFIDGNVWMIPDSIARGAVLYRDVVHWFGPFTPYFHAAFFRVFGSSYTTLVLVGVIGSVATVGALFYSLRQGVPRTEALLWSALSIPALIFMPNSGGAILGMGYRIWHAATFTLAAIGLSCRSSPDRGEPNPLVIGLLCGMAGLCRTEWGLAALLGSVAVEAARYGISRRFSRQAVLTALVFLAVFGTGLGLMVAVAGAGPVLGDGHLLLISLPEETKAFLLNFSGIRDWRRGLLQLLYSASLCLLAAITIEVWAVIRIDPRRLQWRLPWLAGGHLFVALHPEYGGGSSVVLFSVAPLACAISLIAGIRRPHEPRSAVLIGFGLVGLVLFHRKPFFIGDSPYVGPPLLFALVATAAVADHAIEAERLPEVRSRLRRGLRIAVVALIGFAFWGRTLQYVRDPRIPVLGTDGMVTADSSTVRTVSLLTERIRRDTPVGGALVVFPEGEVLNYLTGRQNPLRHQLYIPGYLSRETEPEILCELERAKPAAIVVLRRFAGEYGRAYFGNQYGRPTLAWIRQNYEERPFGANVPGQPVHLFLRTRNP